MAFYSAYDMMLIGYAVADALFNAFENPTQSEPQLVANLVRELPLQINKVALSGTTKVKAGGVFIHARPCVASKSFPAPQPASVEIGDLLLIRSLIVNDKVKEKRALLLQAKKSNKIPAVPDNKNQWHLYEHWPGFSYATKSGGLKGKRRSIKEPDMYDAAKYLLIGPDSAASSQHRICCMDWPFHWHHHWSEICSLHTAQPTTPEMSRYRCFAGELVEFLAGNAGKIFTNPKPRTRGWDRTIQDLIVETAKAKTIFMGRAAGQSTSGMRGSGVLYYSSATQSKFSLIPAGDDGRDHSSTEPPNVPDRWNVDDDGGGIPIIEFVVEQGDS